MGFKTQQGTWTQGKWVGSCVRAAPERRQLVGSLQGHEAQAAHGANQRLRLAVGAGASHQAHRPHARHAAPQHDARTRKAAILIYMVQAVAEACDVAEFTSCCVGGSCSLANSSMALMQAYRV